MLSACAPDEYFVQNAKQGLNRLRENAGFEKNNTGEFADTTVFGRVSQLLRAFPRMQKPIRLRPISPTITAIH